MLRNYFGVDACILIPNTEKINVTVTSEGLYNMRQLSALIFLIFFHSNSAQSKELCLKLDFLDKSANSYTYTCDLLIEENQWEEAFEVPQSIEKYRSYLRDRGLSDLNQISLLLRQKTIFLSHGFLDEAKRIEDVAERRTGRLSSASLLDSALVDIHLGLMSHKKPSEFEALIFRKTAENSSKYKIVASSAGAISVKRNSNTTQILHALRESGWDYIFHLHNHPFCPGHTDVGGTLCPSKGDILVWKQDSFNFGLQRARISNGFDSWEIDTDDL